MCCTSGPPDEGESSSHFTSIASVRIMTDELLKVSHILAMVRGRRARRRIRAVCERREVDKQCGALTQGGRSRVVTARHAPHAPFAPTSTTRWRADPLAAPRLPAPPRSKVTVSTPGSGTLLHRNLWVVSSYPHTLDRRNNICTLYALCQLRPCIPCLWKLHAIRGIVHGCFPETG